MSAVPGQRLERPCGNSRHGESLMGLRYSRDEYDPDCQTCFARVEILSQHDHLHLGRGEECSTPGITGIPGQMVKCKCGSFHH